MTVQMLLDILAVILITTILQFNYYFDWSHGTKEKIKGFGLFLFINSSLVIGVLLFYSILN